MKCMEQSGKDVTSLRFSCNSDTGEREVMNELNSTSGSSGCVKKGKK